MAQELKDNIGVDLKKDASNPKESKNKEVKSNKNNAKPKKDFKKFVLDVKSELKKVIWPGKVQLVNNTITVLAACIIVGAVIWIADLGFERLYIAVFNK